MALSRQLTDPLADALNCSICLCIFTEPLLLTPCMHRFCVRCFDDWKRNRVPLDCPNCRQRVTSQLRDRLLEEVIEGVEKLRALTAAPSVPATPAPAAAAATPAPAAAAATPAPAAPAAAATRVSPTTSHRSSSDTSMASVASQSRARSPSRLVLIETDSDEDEEDEEDDDGGGLLFGRRSLARLGVPTLSARRPSPHSAIPSSSRPAFATDYSGSGIGASLHAPSFWPSSLIGSQPRRPAVPLLRDPVVRAGSGAPAAATGSSAVSPSTEARRGALHPSGSPPSEEDDSPPARRGYSRMTIYSPSYIRALRDSVQQAEREQESRREEERQFEQARLASLRESNPAGQSNASASSSNTVLTH